ncbi:MAG: hypothetical protein LJE90_08395 [Betaproteobacteria bacterium]|jgi:electron transfer flavoprotein alpha subunit|nr:hypothetical protein [Betaproteobacteria bacterium]
MKLRGIALPLVVAGVLATATLALAQHQHGGPDDQSAHMMAEDHRVPVKFPPQLRAHTLINMRDHLLALAQIQDALAAGAYDEAAKIAEQRLGMSSLIAHNAHEAAKYMPQGMQDAGTAMHRGASRFAIELQKTAVSEDLKPALAALAETTQACVACHAGYRLE